MTRTAVDCPEEEPTPVPQPTVTLSTGSSGWYTISWKPWSPWRSR